ncbi:hypothetical protein BDW22DRAFT_1356630 [Trametopsis cervina]|nr:hypothetical protein BDW22DRAFT_1356630 [Trametopsis cervina]
MFMRTLPIFCALLALFVLFAESEGRPMRSRTYSKKELVEARDWSNSKRLANGLPPRAPNLRRTPTRRGSPSASPSPSPSVGSTVKTFSGRIIIKTTPAAPFIGFVSGGSPARVDVKGATGGDLEVQFTTPLFSNTPFNLQATNGNFTSAFIGGAGDSQLAAHSSAHVQITNVNATPINAEPTSAGASAIWVFDYRTHQIKPRWVNVDGSVPNVVIGYNWQSNELFLTGDLAAYNSATGGKAVAVQFYLSA